MKLTDEQKKEKLARDNIRRLINRVSSEYSFRKWRNLRGYLHSIGSDKSVIESTQDKELTRPELDELLRQYEEAAFKQLQVHKDSNGSNAIKSNESSIITKESKERHLSTEQRTSIDSNINASVRNESNEVEKFTEKNNYGLSKSEKENITLFWFQKKAAAELLKGFVQ